MNYRTFKQNKLVRDKVIPFLEQHGSKFYSYALNDQDFAKQLKIKLLEETHEVIQAKTHDELAEELADLLEVLHSLAEIHNISLKKLEEVQLKKRADKGGYKTRTFITFAEHPKDSPQERYCLADPLKYPEVKQ